MSETPFISILVAEDNDISRQLMTGILENQGLKVWGAVDGSSAVKVVQERKIHLAVVDVNMAPEGGLEFMKYLIHNRLNIPVVLVTGDKSSDLLVEASSLGAALVLQKPVEPEKLLKSINHILKRRGLNIAPIAIEARSHLHSPEELMHRAISLAAENMRKGRGRPFAAIIADQDGRILGTGTNGHASRADPMAHAEVVAVRKAVEQLGTADLSGCTLYCSSRPTKLGEALIESVAIPKVYYGIDHSDLQQPMMETKPPVYEQMCRDEALALFRPAQK